MIPALAILFALSVALVVYFVFGRKKKRPSVYAELDYDYELPVPRSMASMAMPSGMPTQQDFAEPPFNTEEYKHIEENAFQDPRSAPFSTFSIDVDTASYSNLRRFVNMGQTPPASAVRIEEYINYFSYEYPAPTDGRPFSMNLEAAACPWNSSNKLVRIALKGKQLNTADVRPSNLVFLIDRSGSMALPNKLPLLKTAFKLLLRQLGGKDFVSIAYYASNVGVALAPTPADQRDKIEMVLDSFTAEGATAGGGGISLAYELAAQHFLPEGNNRVIVATDGDFNIGTTAEGSLVEMIEKKRASGVHLTICGFGMGNYKDSKMKELTKAGGGNYFYIDTELEAKKVFQTQMQGTLFTIATDVKIQVEFNPARVQAYRLIGYETKKLEAQDFHDDKKRASELGAGHTVTAFYELIPAGVTSDAIKVIDQPKYQRSETTDSPELMTVKLRYKLPGQEQSELISQAVNDVAVPFERASDDFRFASAVACLGLVLKNSANKGTADFDLVLRTARQSQGADSEGYRSEFLRLAETLSLRIPSSKTPE